MQVAVCPLRDRKELPRSRSQAASNQGHLRWHTRTTQLTLCTHACMPCATKCFWTPCNALINSLILGAEVLEDTEKQVAHNAGNGSLEILPCSRSPPWKFPTARYTKALGKKPKCTVQRKTTTQNIRLQRKKSFLSQIWWFAYPSAQGINMLGTWRKQNKTHTHFVSIQLLHASSRMHASVILKPWCFQRQQRKWKRSVMGQEWEHKGLRREKGKRRNTSSLATAGSKHKHQVPELYKTEECCNTEILNSPFVSV